MNRRHILLGLAALAGTLSLPSLGNARPLIVTLSADTTSFDTALRELAVGLESRDVLERFDQRLLANLKSAAAGVGISELCKLSAVSTRGARVLTIQLEPGQLLHDCLAALRALTGKLEINDHEGLPSVGIEDWPQDSRRGERPS